MTAYWCCASCGWRLPGSAPRSEDECDNCGDDEFMCSECARDDCDHVEAAVR